MAFAARSVACRADCRSRIMVVDEMQHQKIDPLGFALENFDPMGLWRTHDAVGRKLLRRAQAICCRRTRRQQEVPCQFGIVPTYELKSPTILFTAPCI